MQVPPSPLFRAVPLDGVYTHERARLPAGLEAPAGADLLGARTLRGMPFRFGPSQGPCVLVLEREPVDVALDGALATHVLVVHAVADRVRAPAGLPASGADGRDLGDAVAEYALVHAGGGRSATAIRRRFAIQQTRIGWGSSPFAAVPAADPAVLRTAGEADALGVPLGHPYGVGETRTESARDASETPAGHAELVWIHALRNPRPDEPLERLELRPGDEPCAVYAVTLARVGDHPLRDPRRLTLRVRLPEGARRNALGEPVDIGVDLGALISATPALDYDAAAWVDGPAQVQPRESPSDVLLEVAAHPDAVVYVADADGAPIALDGSRAAVRVLEPAERPVRVRIVERGGGRPLAARLHMHDDAGRYLPPLGHHRRVNGGWFEDYAGELVSGRNQHAYVDGDCEALLPLGRVHVEVTRGLEVLPLRRTVEIGTETEEVLLEPERVLRWRERGWVSADTHVHFLSPPTALLEGQAEGVNVVNLLAAQWGEMFSNVADFDGATTLGARELGGSGEFLVRVGSENRMQVLGHISLLGYSGRLIHPLSSGGPSESALGDALDVTMADWARRCREQGGLVVLPHAPDPQLEGPADVALGLVDAVEMMTPNPLAAENGQVSPYGLAEWYRQLNLGHHLPVVGGSDKMSASMLLGGIRTYAMLGDAELDYEAWMAAVRGGDTFVTVGPLVDLRVEGVRPGGRVALPQGGGRVALDWRVESAALPLGRVEVVVGGMAVDERTLEAGALGAEGTAEVRVRDSSWVAVRVRASYRGDPDDVAAHTSAVFLDVEGSPHFSPLDAAAVLDQIEGALAYVDTIAARPDARRLRELRATLEAAYDRLHQRLHRAGVYHRHGPLHPRDEAHEH